MCQPYIESATALSDKFKGYLLSIKYAGQKQAICNKFGFIMLTKLAC